MVVAPPPPPPLPAPQETSRFELADAQQNVIGDLQQTTVGKDDTLTDIARRFNLGYEELLRANPGVDPWLPGVGRTIVLPTRFVLPDAPHDGVVINIAAMRLFYFPPHKAGETQVVFTHPDRHRQGGLGDAGGHHQDRAPAEGSDLASADLGHQGAQGKRRCAAGGGRSRTGQSAGQPGVLPDLAGLSDPRHQQAGRRRACAPVMAASGCSRKTSTELFDKIPIGTQVHVVNQPYVFGWDNGQLVMQSFGSLEDDRRDWKKAQAALLSRSLGKPVQKELKDRGETVDWDLVMQLAHAAARPDRAGDAHRCQRRQGARQRHEGCEPVARRRLLGRQDGSADGREDLRPDHGRFGSAGSPGAGARRAQVGRLSRRNPSSKTC